MITILNLKFSISFDEWSYVFTQDGESSQSESRRRGRLAGLALAAERDCVSSDTYGAGVECQDTPTTQNKSHDWPQEIGRRILIGERRKTSSPNTLCCAIHKETCFIAIGKFKKFRVSVRSKHERRIVSLDFSGLWVLQAGRQTHGFSHPVRFWTSTHCNVVTLKVGKFLSKGINGSVATEGQTVRAIGISHFPRILTMQHFLEARIMYAWYVLHCRTAPSSPPWAWSTELSRRRQ